MDTPPLRNPYVGPRSFTQDDAAYFFGREQEARDLGLLVTARRLVLFYAQSGAGKTSLLHTRLIPQLWEEGFIVLPPGRVSGGLTDAVETIDNIFTFNLILSLQSQAQDIERFAQLNLRDFLANLTTDDGQHFYYDDSSATAQTESASSATSPAYVLIIDQFEEILTAHLSRWADRASFFQQLNQAMMADPNLWVVLVMREDYVSQLTPYAPHLQRRLQDRFYMERMDHAAALQAIKQPAKNADRPFAEGVAERLADNLRQIKQAGNTGSAGILPAPLGQYIEPVQLQVVCYQLWQNLQENISPPGPPKGGAEIPPSGGLGGLITFTDLETLGNVDTALAQFYEDILGDTITATKVAEIDLRNWFEQELITEAGTRGTVFYGAEQTGNLTNAVVDYLASRFILRPEVRPGGTWYELIHDRLVEPILQANQDWRLEQPLLQVALAWDEAGRPKSRLLRDDTLENALSGNWPGLGPLVAEFMEASQKHQAHLNDKAAQAEAEQQQRELEAAQELAEVKDKAAQRAKRLSIGLAILGAIAVILALIAAFFALQANNSRAIAEDNAATAQGNAVVAQTSEAQAQTNAKEAQQAGATAQAAKDLVEAQAQVYQSADPAQRLKGLQTLLVHPDEAVQSQGRWMFFGLPREEQLALFQVDDESLLPVAQAL